MPAFSLLTAMRGLIITVYITVYILIITVYTIYYIATCSRTHLTNIEILAKRKAITPSFLYEITLESSD